MNILGFARMGIKNIGKFLTRESPSILTGLGVTGLITTTILGIKATPKALYLINLYHYNQQDDTPLTFFETVKLTWKCYIPTVTVGATTIACILGANSINLSRNAALAGLYTLTEKTLQEYQDKVVELLGKTKDEKIRDEIAQDKLNKNPVEQVFLTGRGETLFFDSLSGRYFKSDMETIRRVQNDFNEELLKEMYKPLNDFYYLLGLENTELGRSAGWDVEKGLLDIRFSAKIASNNTPCIVLDYTIVPKIL